MSTSVTQGERGYGLLLEHCSSLTRGSGRAPATARLEHALGCELARLLVVALARRRGGRGTI
jgi:hypothetical protein